MSISNAELYDMIGVYFECHQNATIASRIYSVRYPYRRHYGKEVFKRKARRLRETGSFHRPCFKRCSRGINEDNSINVLALIQQNPHISSRQISIELNIPKTTVLRILKHHRFVFHIIK